MARADRGRVRTALLRAAVPGVLALLAALTPATAGAFSGSITDRGNSAATKAQFTCGDLFAGTRSAASKAYFEYAFGEDATAPNAADSSAASNPGVYQGGHAVDVASPMACPNDGAKSASVLDGTSQYVYTSASVGTTPVSFSIAIWFKTTQKGGRLLGLSGAKTGASGSYDRHLYLEPTGQLAFGSYSSGYQIITSPSGTNYADGVWHLAVATMTSGSPNTGSILYVDGAQSGANASFTTAQANTGYWRVGWDSMSNAWTNNTATTAYFKGSIRFAAAYRFVLTPAEVASMWSVGSPG